MASSPRPAPPRPGFGALKARTAEILRVDHAGELAAVHIYRGQQAVFQAAGKDALGASFASLREQEAAHLKAFDALLSEHGVVDPQDLGQTRPRGAAAGARQLSHDAGPAARRWPT